MVMVANRMSVDFVAYEIHFSPLLGDTHLVTHVKHAARHGGYMYHRMSCIITGREEKYAPPLHFPENVPFLRGCVPASASSTLITYSEARLHTSSASSNIEESLYARYAVMQATPQNLQRKIMSISRQFGIVVRTWEYPRRREPSNVCKYWRNVAKDRIGRTLLRGNVSVEGIQE